jgi:hypothetical protein
MGQLTFGVGKMRVCECVLPRNTPSDLHSHILGMADIVCVQNAEIFSTKGKQPQYSPALFIEAFDECCEPTKHHQRICLARADT